MHTRVCQLQHREFGQRLGKGRSSKCDRQGCDFQGRARQFEDQVLGEAELRVCSSCPINLITAHTTSTTLVRYTLDSINGFTS